MADYYDLGKFGRRVTCACAQAQLWFDRGLTWCYAFHHEEAIVCFETALTHDADCAMAHWGIAYAIGPIYNKQWEAFVDDDLGASLATARAETAAAMALTERCSAVEKALIETLPRRYPRDAPVADCSSWNDAYAAAMRQVFTAHGDDLDVRALFAEALMNRTPWALWDLPTGAIAHGADTVEARAVLERAFADHANANAHPGLLHMYVHLMEMSPHPELALRAGDNLRNLIPDAGHLRHMPTHIDVLCGHYQSVVDSNGRAIEADRKYLERQGAVNFYSAYRCHNYHFKIYGAMFLGQYATAIDAAEEMITTLPRELLNMGSPPMADWLEGFIPMKQHVLIRFGKWDEIIGQDLPQEK
jgi:hypothetical protein